MKLDKILRCISSPWFIMPEQFQAFFALVPGALQLWENGKLTIEAGRGARGEYEERSVPGCPGLPWTVEDGVAVLPITGVLGLGWDEWEKKYCNMIDVDDIDAALAAIMADENVVAVVLDFDSPGGLVIGTPELAVTIAIHNMDKPIYSFTRNLMASGAYYLASGSAQIYSSPSSIVGSIGVYLPLLDVSGLYEKLGLKKEIFKSGKYKAAGAPGTSLTPEQRVLFQDHVDFAGDQFKTHVTTYRDLETETMEGQALWGKQALDVGLIDAVGTLEKTIEDARTAAALLAS